MAITQEQIDAAKQKVLTTPARVKTKTAEIQNRTAAEILAIEAGEAAKAASTQNPLGITITKAIHITRGGC